MIRSKIIFLMAGVVLIGAGILIGGFFANNFSYKAPGAPAAYSFINPTVSSTLNKHFIINFLPLKNN